MRLTRRALVALLPLSVLCVAACGSSSPSAGSAYGGSAPTSPPAVASSAAPMIPAKTTLTVRKTALGYVLATASGRTIYWYAKDVKGSGVSTCTGSCLDTWPAVTGTPSLPAGVVLNGKIGTITRPGGVVQVTYNGYPLYTYAGDTSAGSTSGNGVGGVWHVISGGVLSSNPAAAAAASAAAESGSSASTAPSPSSAASSSGYNYGGGGY